jgi:hypothetical protein
MFLFHSPDGGSEPITSLDAERLAHSVSNTVRAITPRLQDFHQILLDPPKVCNTVCAITHRLQDFHHLDLMVCHRFKPSCHLINTNCLCLKIVFGKYCTEPYYLLYQYFTLLGNSIS